ncbi:hypothetical protein EYZ11_000986 [Aspergillus tanneri]|uniref:Uncharacterized protein n=1 Tax=Aspergillus tanneri TaxID=1220188 RepID=A0A4S3JVR1_9EURO|nr:hypothetical protein EYZ11_000986 [Aspergillus tanneri]
MSLEFIQQEVNGLILNAQSLDIVHPVNPDTFLRKSVSHSYSTSTAFRPRIPSLKDATFPR